MPWDISSLTSSSWYSFSSGFITLLSFVGMIYFYFKSKKDKRPLFIMKSTNILKDLSGKFKALQVTYDETLIKNLTLTRIGLWNSGKETIKKDDIAKRDPLIIKTKNGAKILDVQMEIPKDTPNGFEYVLSEDLCSLNFTFDYIEKNQGAIFQLLHTGTSRADIELTGSIIGFGHPKYSDIISRNLNARTVSSFITPLIGNNKLARIIDNHYDLLLSLSAVFMGTIVYLSRNLLSQYATPAMITFGGLLYIFAGVVALLIWFTSLSNQIPPGFEALYFDDEANN